MTFDAKELVSSQYCEEVYVSTLRDSSRDSDYPTHFLARYGVTIRWLNLYPDYNTVGEYDLWHGHPDDPEVTKYRKSVLFECDHNAIMELTKRIISGDSATLEMLYRYSKMPDAVFGFDHFRKEPRIILYPENK